MCAATNMWTDQQAGPASYTTGGFVITTTLGTLAALDVEVNVPGAVIGQVRFVIALNTPAAGQATVKVMRQTYQKLSLGSPSGLPGGVTSPAASGSSVATETPHSHAADHDHAVSAASTTLAGGSGLVTQAAVGAVNTSTHTHTVNLANLVVATGTQTHQHTWDHIYQHAHAVSTAATDVTLVELANGTVLSGATLNYLGVDV